MLMILLTCLLSFVLGGVIGDVLAKQGYKADLNLERYQFYLLGGLILFTVGIVVAVVFQNSDVSKNFSTLLPAVLRLYFQASFANLILGICCSIMGLLTFLERPGWNSPQRVTRLFLSLMLMALPFSLILHYAIPVSATELSSPRVYEGVVLQTTDYTCVPASLANLMRYSGRDPNFSEADALAVTHTTRWGTSTIDEIRGLRQLGFKPEFQSGLTLNDLAKRQQLAILHVYEPVANRRIFHVVLLLSLSPKQQQVLIANPISGKQTKTYLGMKGYWTGEAIFIKQ